MNNRINQVRKKMLPVMRAYGVKKASLFGSCVRQEMKKSSDIDVLVEIDADISLLDFIELKQKLEEAVGRTVDLVEYDTLKPFIREHILKKKVVLL
jgi:predicted nucleotidyltransferase